MLDWLVEVTTAFKCRDRTYFLAASLFDEFLKQFPDKLENKDVHGIGIASLYLASKYEDVHPLGSEVISDKISHGAFTDSNIKTREMIMLRTLEFNLDIVTHFDIHFNLLRAARLQSRIIHRLFTKITELSTQIVLMTMQHPKFYKVSVSKAVVGAIISACCILEAQRTSTWDESECQIDQFKRIVWNDS